ncbi:hypothetical protein OSB04_021063 [Centaurea solstitialis]|uniref:LisH domain-containing protein n=1 Tax=Centaurea solstitialis TaxID=347529 RepID=A0AA38STH9_9ASTR|nr:hypothetical protein OSB04_021063 [Centaurea solstitialis]
MEDNNFNHNQLYERFLYDYFIDKGFYETAEVFRRETLARAYPSEIDVPNELLLEWWVVNSDFSEWESKNSLNNEGSCYRAEATVSQQSGLTLSSEDALNEQMIEELTLDYSFGVILGHGDILVPETAPNPGSMIPFSAPANQGYTDNEGLESVVQAYLRTTTVESNEACLSVPNSESLISLSALANQDNTHNEELDFVVQDFPSTTMIASKEVGLAVPNSGNLMPSFPLVNHGGTDNQGLESIVEAFVRPRNESNENYIAKKQGDTLSLNGQRFLQRRLDNRANVAVCTKDGFIRQDNSFNLPTYLVEAKNDEEGNFCSKGITLKLSSSLMEEKQEDANFVEGDTFELSSIVKGKKIEEGGSSSRDAYVYDSSSHDKGNEDDGVISAINLDELHDAPNNDERQGVTAGGTSVLQTMPHSESLAWSSAPPNLNGPDTLGPHSAVQAIVNTTEITSTEENYEEGNFSSKDENYKLSSSFMEEEKDDTGVFTTKLDSFHLVPSVDKGMEKEEGLPLAKMLICVILVLMVKEMKEEGAFSGQYETFKLTSSLLEEKKDVNGASSTKNNRFERLLSPVEDKEDNEGDSATRNAHMDCSSYGKGNEDDDMLFCSSLAQHK